MVCKCLSTRRNTIIHSLQIGGNLGCDQADDDVRKTMELFKELGANNPWFTYRVQADLEGRIKCLMWMNGSSHLRLQASAWFTGEMNPRALGWTQQVTIGVAA